MEIILTVENYDLEQITVEIIRKLIKDYPDLTNKEYAQMLCISERTFYRWVVKYKLQRPLKKAVIESMIASLEENGYKITKK